MLQINQTYKISCTDLSVEGAGIGRADSIVVFVLGLLPGEEAMVKIVKAQKTYAIGELIELKKSTPARIEPECPYFFECGGCSLMHLDYQAQFAWKQNHVVDCFKKITGIEINPTMCIPADSPLQYRNKATFFVKNNKIGYYAEKSHRVVPISKCLLLVPQINETLRVLQDWLEKTTIKTELLQKIIVRANKRGEILVGVVLRKKDATLLQEIVDLLRTVPQVKGILFGVGNVKSSSVKFQLLWGAKALQEIFAGLSFEVAIDSFMQVNYTVAEALYQAAFDLGKLNQADTVFDLYSGVGTLTLAAAQRTKKAYGVEIVQSAVENAKQNAHKNKIDNAVFLLADAATAFQLVEEKPDVVIVDPPRRGLVPSLIEDIAKRSIEKVIYISCNPATLARDAKLFIQAGYKVEKLAVVDMFAQTTHVETVVLMSRDM